MNRFSRISTIWRKEFTDTLRDRRTLLAMVLMPMVLYPVLMLGSLIGFELQVGRLRQEKYTIAVADEQVRNWLQRRILDQDPARHPAALGLPAEEVEAAIEAEAEEQTARRRSPTQSAEKDVRFTPPPYDIVIIPDVQAAVKYGAAHVGLLVRGAELPTPESQSSAEIVLLMDQTEIRSQIAAAGLEGILERANMFWGRGRLLRLDLPADYTNPIMIHQHEVASAEKVGGSVLGQIVPLILIIMTITGAIYPAIDLTAGERERGTLETLMAAPVPKVDLIAGKFVVVASIGMLSAVLNLFSIGGTIWLGGLGDILTQGGAVQIPLHTLPMVLVVLIPLAIMFSALLLAVCSFARSFKEAQNYVMPVLVGALIPAVIGILPGTELDGPLLVMPVTNIVILTRDLFMGQVDPVALLWVTLSTCIYAAAAVAVAAKLFGQEAVLFADSASIRVLFQRRLFRPSDAPSAPQAFLLLAAVYILNFFIQQALGRSGSLIGGPRFFYAIAGVLVLLMILLPSAVGLYSRVRLLPAFGIRPPPALAMLAGLCFGLSTWILATAWVHYQGTWMPLPPELAQEGERILRWLDPLSPFSVVLLLALIPALAEELFFRGYALSGIRRGLGSWGGVLVIAAAFAMSHQSVHRLLVTGALGILFGLLVIRSGSIWPAVLAHFLHNGISILSTRTDGLQPILQRLGYPAGVEGQIPSAWTFSAGALVLVGLMLCAMLRPARTAEPETDPLSAPQIQ